MTDEESTTPAEDASPIAPNPAEDEATPKKRKTWVWILVAVAAVAVIAIVYAGSQGSDGGSWLLLFRGTTVPQLTGLSQQDAEAAIVAAGLTVGEVSDTPTLAVAPGTVVDQSPAASTKVEEESPVDVSVSAVPTANVPDVVGKTLSDASATLADEGLLVGATSYVYDSKVKAGLVKSQDPAADTDTHVGAAVALTVSKGPQTGQVPNVVGLSEADAKTTLEGAGFKVTTTKAANADVPAGDVVSQSPAAGTVVAAGSTVTISVSTGPPPAPKPSVPNVVGLPEADAKTALEDAGFKVTTTQAANADVPAGAVISQSPAAGAVVAAGSTVSISVSTGAPAAPKPTVPNVVGLSENDAKSTLEGAGFTGHHHQGRQCRCARGRCDLAVARGGNGGRDGEHRHHQSVHGRAECSAIDRA